MNLDDPVIKLCVESTQAEYAGRLDEARALCMQAWEAARDDFDACVAAHYVARYQESPEETLRWNQEALNRADAVADGRVQDFYPSLYLAMGRSHEALGNQAEAQRYYHLAAELGVAHYVGEPGADPGRCDLCDRR
jgi:tetratricopeptide (TPR) repeat protein